jgi:hypothetical protein
VERHVRQFLAAIATAVEDRKMSVGNTQAQTGMKRKQPPVNGDISRLQDTGSICRYRHAKSKTAMSEAAVARAAALAHLKRL